MRRRRGYENGEAVFIVHEEGKWTRLGVCVGNERQAAAAGP